MIDRKSYYNSLNREKVYWFFATKSLQVGNLGLVWQQTHVIHDLGYFCFPALKFFMSSSLSKMAVVTHLRFTSIFISPWLLAIPHRPELCRMASCWGPRTWDISAPLMLTCILFLLLHHNIYLKGIALCDCSVQSGKSFQVSEVGKYLQNLKSLA